MEKISILFAVLALMLPNGKARHPDKIYPPTWHMLVKIARCEQPGYGWNGVAWHQTRNYSFAGGMGMTNLNWDTFKRKGQPDSMADATIIEQLWAAHRLGMWVKKKYGDPWIAWTCYTNGSVKD